MRVHYEFRRYLHTIQRNRSTTPIVIASSSSNKMVINSYGWWKSTIIQSTQVNTVNSLCCDARSLSHRHTFHSMHFLSVVVVCWPPKIQKLISFLCVNELYASGWHNLIPTARIRTIYISISLNDIGKFAFVMKLTSNALIYVEYIEKFRVCLVFCFPFIVQFTSEYCNYDI